jgi:cell division protein FtsW
MPATAYYIPLTSWWRTIDRPLLIALLTLMTAGLVFLMAGGPPVADRLHLPTFYFVNRQIIYLIPALGVLLFTSFLSLRLIRRFALLLYIVSLGLVFGAIMFGPEIKGAHRWLSLGGFSIQPSEFLKPSFVILASWFFSAKARGSDVPGTFLGILLLPMTIGPLVLQPDIGQVILTTFAWMVLFFVAGLSLFWVFILGLSGMGGVVMAYIFFAHVRSRIGRFLDKSSGGDTFQIDTALQAFEQGGWWGRGPGEGSIKRILPDAHTDFIFSVMAEEFGIIMSLVIVLLFGFIVWRGFRSAYRTEEPFCRLAAIGLTALFGFQAVINMMVNVHLMPAKGMTLPFISFGGSSLLSLALAMGFLMAVTRRRPGRGAHLWLDD